MSFACNSYSRSEQEMEEWKKNLTKAIENSPESTETEHPSPLKVPVPEVHSTSPTKTEKEDSQRFISKKISPNNPVEETEEVTDLLKPPVSPKTAQSRSFCFFSYQLRE